jgi:uncharacterized protein
VSAPRPHARLLAVAIAILAGPASAGTDEPWLEREASPYLREHARDGTLWRPWGSEAFDEARRRRALVLVSIGEWSDVPGRVLETDVLGAPETTAALARYVAIKVDRDERPDVARVYAAAALVADAPFPSGPFVAILTPDARPVRVLALSLDGRPVVGLGATLGHAADAFAANPGETEARAGASVAALREAQTSEAPRRPLGRDVVDRALLGLKEAFLPRQGAFGGPPLLPPHGALRLLLQQAGAPNGAEALRIATLTLDAIGKGSLRDAAAGGFFHQAEDEGWRRPSPAKTLADNALLLRAYAAAYELTGRDDYESAAKATARFLTAVLADPDGGFRAATRATTAGAVETDERVFAGANGLAIGALASGAHFLPGATDAARAAAARVLERLGPAGSLRRAAVAQEARGDAVLEDYAYLAEGLLDLHDATEDARWRKDAAVLVDAAIVRFLDPRSDGFFDGPGSDPLLPARLRDGYDGSLPNANGVMASVLVRLAAATGEKRYAEQARRTVSAFLGDLQRAPRGIETLAAAASLVLGAPHPSTGTADAPLPAREVRGPVTVEASVSSPSVRPGQDLEARVRLAIAAGWRVNAHRPGPKDLVGLTVGVPGALLVAGAPRYPSGRPYPQTFSAEAAAGLEGEATVAVPLRVPADAPAGEQRVRVRVGFQACDARACQGPESVVLETPLVIARP